MSLSLKLGLIYLISEFLLTVTRRSRCQNGTKEDRSTLRVLWMVIMVSIAAGVFVAGNWRAAALLHGQVFAIAGVATFIAEEPKLHAKLIGQEGIAASGFGHEPLVDACYC